ncbi:MAG: fructose-bisphosphatase class II family protein [Candidatus Bathyarchaeota archaeon]|nr:fructose-bisphosphatase class II family protein [Candidatus Bathyarchaeota archaeon]MDH5745970.1 fructose-bisphosphatase class II family protein [Candidatus Bathyarchaeota archaeon]
MVSLRALAPSLVRITTAAAVGAALHIGQGNPNLIDEKAIEFSRAVLAQTEIDAEVISCEGPKDDAPAFVHREKVGTGKGPKVEFVIDPVDGSTASSKGRKDAISALACAPAGCFQVLPDDGYYFKVATDYNSAGKFSLDMSIAEIVRRVAVEKGLRLENFTVIMLERERHLAILKSLRKLGVRIILIPDGDIAGAVVTCRPGSGVDLLVGAGAGPEATIAATALKCLGGTMLVKVWRDKKDDPNRLDRLRTEGVDVDKTYSEDELAKGNELVFAASGVTKGELLDGVRFIPNGAIVNSICMRLPSGTVEKSETTLRFKGHPVYKQFLT